MDVAAVLVNYMDEATSIEWFHNVPMDAPARFGTLTRDGGPSEAVRDIPTVTLMVHAASRGAAAQLAFEAKQALGGQRVRRGSARRLLRPARRSAPPPHHGVADRE